MNTCLYNTLEATKGLKERIEFIKTASYNAYTVDQPGPLVELFIVQTPSEASDVAEAFAQRFRLDAIDRDVSLCAKRFMTIMDCLDDVYQFEHKKHMRLLIDAFNRVGFKRAKDCSEQVLWMNYCCDKNYSNYPVSLKVDVGSIPSYKRYLQEDVYKPNKRIC